MHSVYQLCTAFILWAAVLRLSSCGPHTLISHPHSPVIAHSRSLCRHHWCPYGWTAKDVQGPKETQKPLHSVVYLRPRKASNLPYQSNSDVWSVAESQTYFFFILIFNKGYFSYQVVHLRCHKWKGIHSVLVAAYFPLKLCNHVKYLRLQMKLQMLYLWGEVHVISRIPVSDLNPVFAAPLLYIPENWPIVQIIRSLTLASKIIGKEEKGALK